MFFYYLYSKLQFNQLALKVLLLILLVRYTTKWNVTMKKQDLASLSTGSITDCAKENSADASAVRRCWGGKICHGTVSEIDCFRLVELCIYVYVCVCVCASAAYYTHTYTHVLCAVRIRVCESAAAVLHLLYIFFSTVESKKNGKTFMSISKWRGNKFRACRRFIETN